MSLTTEIRKTAAESPLGDPGVLAHGLLQKLSRDEIGDMLAADIAYAQRELTRDNEKEAFSALFMARADRPAAPPAELKGLFRERFSVGDGSGGVEWGKATVEQHETRVAMLEAMRVGLLATIQRHQEAIEIIQTSGTSCLEEALALRVTV